MPHWLARTLSRIHRMVATDRVRLTRKAQEEARALHLLAEDVEDLLASLAASHYAARLRSDVTGETMFVFVLLVGDTPMYIKLVLRNECVVVSFHEDAEADVEA
jgi:hypothetical protein